MIQIETKKVRGIDGTKGLLVLKAACLPKERLPKEYLEIKEPGDIKITGQADGILIEKIDENGKPAWVLIRKMQAYDYESFMARWEDIKLAGNRLTDVKAALRAAWDGELSFKY